MVQNVLCALKIIVGPGIVGCNKNVNWIKLVHNIVLVSLILLVFFLLVLFLLRKEYEVSDYDCDFLLLILKVLCVMYFVTLLLSVNMYKFVTSSFWIILLYGMLFFM